VGVDPYGSGGRI